MAENTLSLWFSNTREESPRMSRQVEKFLKDHEIDESITNKVLVCVDELITNIIAHAYSDKQEHAVFLGCNIETGFIELELRDDGTPFDPTTQTPLPNLKGEIEERDIGGLGLHLVKNLMDKVEYVREGDFNVLKTTKYLFKE